MNFVSNSLPGMVILSNIESSPDGQTKKQGTRVERMPRGV